MVAASEAATSAPAGSSPAAAAAEPERRVVERDHLIEAAGLPLHGVGLGAEAGLADEERPHAGVLDDVLELVLGKRVVDGNDDAAERQDREVGDDPLRSVRGQDANDVAAREPEGAEHRGGPLYGLREFGVRGADVPPAPPDHECGPGGVDPRRLEDGPVHGVR